MSGMRHDDRDGNAAPGSLASGRSNPCICAGYPDRIFDYADRNRVAGLIFEKVFGQGATAGTKIGNTGNLTTEHGDLLVAANF